MADTSPFTKYFGWTSPETLKIDNVPIAPDLNFE